MTKVKSPYLATQPACDCGSAHHPASHLFSLRRQGATALRTREMLRSRQGEAAEARRHEDAERLFFVLRLTGRGVPVCGGLEGMLEIAAATAEAFEPEAS